MKVNQEDWHIRFIGEQITVQFDRDPLFSKKPHCPIGFIWDEVSFEITELLSEWRDYGRRDRMARNMRPENIAKTKRKGSWGVGKYFFRIKEKNGRIFDIYYDRAPKGMSQRQGSWYLHREIVPKG